MSDVTRTTITSPRFPLPAGALAAENFEIDYLGRCRRLFTGTRRGTDDVSVEIYGLEEYNGPVMRRGIVVDVSPLDNELDAATARELAQMLIAAADELDDLEAQAGMSDATAIIEP
jgi:hypothetical protein